MGLYFDRAGNAFHITDESVLKKKEMITVTNDRGEEFELPADKADEHRLTPTEQKETLERLQTQASRLGQKLGYCKVFDPIGPEPLCPNHGVKCPSYDFLCPPIARACLPFDAIPWESIQGSLPAETTAKVVDMLRKVLDSCPNIDPPRLGAILGTMVRQAEALRAFPKGCTNVDPVETGTIAGSSSLAGRAELSRDIVSLLRGMLNGCPRIDPVQIGSIIGSIAQSELTNRTK